MLGDNAAVSHGTAEKASELVNLNFVPCEDVGNTSDGFFSNRRMQNIC